MATTTAPAGGSRNGAGPEWGGFEENIQVMAPGLRLPAAPGPAIVLKCRGDSSLGPGNLHLQHFSLLWVFVHTKVSGTSADVKGPDLYSSQRPSGLWAHPLLLPGQARWSVRVRHGRGLGSNALAKTILCVQLCFGVGKGKESGHFLQPFEALMGKVGERHVWETRSRFPRLEKKAK